MGDPPLKSAVVHSVNGQLVLLDLSTSQGVVEVTLMAGNFYGQDFAILILGVNNVPLKVSDLSVTQDTVVREHFAFMRVPEIV